MGEERERDGAERDGAADVSRTRPERAPAREVVEAAPLVAGMVLAGRYEIREAIGRGGMGLVVRAFDRTLGAAVAIKILRADYAGERQWAERLAREVRLARQIHHPNVCRVFNFEESDGRVFLVMELAGGGTLREEIASGAVRSRPLAARLADARAIAEGLAAIHAAGIIHRDLSPQNLLRMNDGRLVISDFGLAVDTSESGTSIRGGTIAYMAPEVVRGGPITFAADLWSLGIVMHEAVFGERPSWRDAASFEMVEPQLGRRLASEERGVLETCRACTAVEPARRPMRTGDVGVRLTRGRAWVSRWHLSRRAVLALAVVAIGVAVGVAIRAASHGRLEQPSVNPVPLIIPTGQPEDWTEKSRVLAELPERIQCVVALPDHHTVRFVWGAPPRAEDLDTETGQRVRSPIVPAAYAEGCPDLSPDGHRLLFQGRSADGHPFAFVSGSPDGRAATPVAPIADPSVDSQPLWMSDGDSFVYDVDVRHVGVFSTGRQRPMVLPEPTSTPYISAWHWLSSDMVFVSASVSRDDTSVSAYKWPSLSAEFRLRLPGFAMSFRMNGSGTVLATLGGPGLGGRFVAVDLLDWSARAVGSVKDQWIREPTFVRDGLFFVSIRPMGILSVRTDDGRFKTLIAGPWLASASRCGTGFMTADMGVDRLTISRRDLTGRFLETVIPESLDAMVSCSADGAVWYYGTAVPIRRVMRCSVSGCSELMVGQVVALAASPDGRRVAFIDAGNHGLAVHVIDTDDRMVRDLTITESPCTPGWSSDRTLWILRERNDGNVWVEVDVETAKETGRTTPGSSNCAEGNEDLKSPVDQDFRFHRSQRAQLRLLRGQL